MKNYRKLIESAFHFEDEGVNKEIIQSFKVKDHLCPDIFESEEDEPTMNSKVRNGLLEITQNFIDSCGVRFYVEDIILTGSLANYNWSKYSDVDLHIIVDYDNIETNKEVMKELFDAKKIAWNENHDVKVKGFDVEIYVQDIKEKHTASGVYSVLNNEWNVAPSKTNPMIDQSKIMQKADEYIMKIDRLMELSKDQNVLPQIENLKERLKKLRKTGLEKEGEYSYENLTFKLLRRNGYIEKLIELKKEMVDKKLSVKETTDIIRTPIQPEVGGPNIGFSYNV